MVIGRGEGKLVHLKLGLRTAANALVLVGILSLLVRNSGRTWDVGQMLQIGFALYGALFVMAVRPHNQVVFCAVG